MFDDISLDPGALANSLYRGQLVLDCYNKLLAVIPNATTSAVYQDMVDFKALVDNWKGDWTGYNDYTTEIIPYETSFMAHRDFYTGKADLSTVPYMVLQKERTVAPKIITDVEAMRRPSPTVAPVASVPAPGLSMQTKLMLGAGAMLLGFVMLRPKRRGFSGFSGTNEEHKNTAVKYAYEAEKALGRGREHPPGSDERKRYMQYVRDYLIAADQETNWIPSDSEEAEYVKNTWKRYETIKKSW